MFKLLSFVCKWATTGPIFCEINTICFFVVVHVGNLDISNKDIQLSEQNKFKCYRLAFVEEDEWKYKAQRLQSKQVTIAQSGFSLQLQLTLMVVCDGVWKTTRPQQLYTFLYRKMITTRQKMLMIRKLPFHASASLTS